MLISDEVFNRFKFDFNKLINYGFQLNENQEYDFKTIFFDDDFLLEIIVNKNNEVKTNVYDNETNEIFYMFNNEKINTSFVGLLREEAKDILIDIREKCCVETLFNSEQANRIVEKIKNKFDEMPDFPFTDMDQYCIFRRQDNKKWYALFMNVKEKSIFKNSSEKFIDVLNIKIQEDKLDDLLKINGIREAYHMNKKKWVTILLNDLLDDETVLELVGISRELVKKS
ncbi:MAG: MmcQ/YjbR family DNA-binding protein [Bacilli bacterium]|nr:MmcQ/YjbR family DNA-binding protein [Bacilli bacterium]